MTRSHEKPNKALLPSSWCFGSPAWSNLSARRDFLCCTAAAALFHPDKNQVNFFNTAARVRRFKLTPRGSMMKTTRQDSKRESNRTIELAFMRLLVAVLKTALLIVATVATAQAEPRQSTERNRNYILRRQEAGLVSGVPTTRRIIGKREIDVYRDGRCLTKKDNVVGVTKR